MVSCSSVQFYDRAIGNLYEYKLKCVRYECFIYSTISLLSIWGSTYIATIGKTQNFELKILWSIYIPDRLVHYNLWFSIFYYPIISLYIAILLFSYDYIIFIMILNYLLPYYLIISPTNFLYKWWVSLLISWLQKKLIHAKFLIYMSH